VAHAAAERPLIASTSTPVGLSPITDIMSLPVNGRTPERAGTASRRAVFGLPPPPRANLASFMVHVLNDTTRHAGHADLLREELDGQTGVAAGRREPIDTLAREARCAQIEKAARAASPTRPD
jgi:Protein of unknown function (DUF664)